MDGGTKVSHPIEQRTLAGDGHPANGAGTLAKCTACLLCGRDIPPFQGSRFFWNVTQGCGDTASKKRSPYLLHPGLVYIAPLGLVPVAVLAFALHLACCVDVSTRGEEGIHRWKASGIGLKPVPISEATARLRSNSYRIARETNK